jgi:hypothetical protein
MNKLIMVCVMMLASTSAFAGVCKNGSVENGYNYGYIGEKSGSTVHAVGRIIFDGKGKAVVSGFRTQDGIVVTESGLGAYTVSSGCLARGVIKWNNGTITNYAVYLDHMDKVPATRLAYHGALIGWTNNGLSFSGGITRVLGKFK